MSSLASRSFQSQSRDDGDNSDWDHSVDTAARDNTGATLRRRLGARFVGTSTSRPTNRNPETRRDGAVADRDMGMPPDPILSDRREYESKLT